VVVLSQNPEIQNADSGLRDLRGRSGNRWLTPGFALAFGLDSGFQDLHFCIGSWNLGTWNLGTTKAVLPRMAIITHI
jgi:hypothetical protein